jgi:phosphoenolpyruvate carboxylase
VEDNRESEFLSHDGPLREDVSRLGAMVGRMLAEQGGTAFFERVEPADVLPQGAVVRQELGLSIVFHAWTPRLG